MIKKLLFAFTFLASLASSNAQSVGIIGGFTSWSSDVVMATTDNTTFTKAGLFLASGSELKFRQDAAWAINWGVTTLGTAAAPSPLTGTADGGQNFYIPAGTYDVSINISTKAYSFTPVILSYDDISMSGGFNQNAMPGQPMVTGDGATYTLTDFYFTAPDAHFVKNGNVMLGGSAFPSGTASDTGGTIPVTVGYYNVTMTNPAYAYSFIQVPVSIIGSSLTGDATGWNIDVDMTSTDGGRTFALNQDLMVGELKFRANYSWNTNWGGTYAASGTAGGGSNFMIPAAGNYNITFDRTTGNFTFTLLSSAYDLLDITGDFNTTGLPLSTSDGITYTANEVYINTTTNFKIVNHNDPNQSWGGSGFPAGTATAGGAAIPVAVGFYNISFNKTSGDYSFSVTPVTMIGAAVGDWSTDVPMTSNDNGITFMANSVVVAAGEMKFRSNNMWATAWGASSAFPSGTASTTGSGNIVVPTAGTYNISFNRLTGDYMFSDLGVGSFDSSKAVVLYDNNTKEVQVYGFDAVKMNIFNMAGQQVKSFNQSASYNVSDLAAGIYIVKVTDANNVDKTVKLAKN
ncbi:MAG: hypothetical protein CFE24_05705 [Flavobacterium sp. BFFFF2]|nr:MAG: hypothetical protein CFE24_05705 [Flavobacterium sp. BFFFF2]